MIENNLHGKNPAFEHNRQQVVHRVPAVILRKIFDQLILIDLLQVSWTCKRWKQVCSKKSKVFADAKEEVKKIQAFAKGKIGNATDIIVGSPYWEFTYFTLKGCEGPFYQLGTHTYHAKRNRPPLCHEKSRKSLRSLGPTKNKGTKFFTEITSPYHIKVFTASNVMVSININMRKLVDSTCPYYRASNFKVIYFHESADQTVRMATCRGLMTLWNISEELPFHQERFWLLKPDTSVDYRCIQGRGRFLLVNYVEAGCETMACFDMEKKTLTPCEGLQATSSIHSIAEGQFVLVYPDRLQQVKITDGELVTTWTQKRSWEVLEVNDHWIVLAKNAGKTCSYAAISTQTGDTVLSRQDKVRSSVQKPRLFLKENTLFVTHGLYIQAFYLPLGRRSTYYNLHGWDRSRKHCRVVNIEVLEKILLIHCYGQQIINCYGQSVGQYYTLNLHRI